MATIWDKCNRYVLHRNSLGKASERDGRIIGTPETVRCEDALKWLYEMLTALDAKASALMRLNGVMVAAASFLITTRVHLVSLPDVTINDARLLLFSAFLSALSIGFCLPVVQVRWTFLGKVKDGDGTFDYTEEFMSLQDEANRRQWLYQIAWWISAGSTLLLLVVLTGQTWKAVFR